MSKSITIAVICGWAALVAADRTALAQAGSIGGTIGKTNKSVLGGNEADTVRRPVAKPLSEPSDTTRKSPCRTILGTWIWVWDNVSGVFKSDGTVEQPTNHGVWTCKDGQYIINWANGMTDHISVSSDGHRFEAVNNLGIHYPGARP